jgi:tetratricopeptide (TPR) repeat protein
LAVNHALTGDRVWSYHLFNLSVHVAAGLALYGIMRRTWRQAPLRARFGPAGEPLALLTAAIWMVHPLQTEAVTYIVQRAESMMGLFFLLTLYFFIRGAASAAPAHWNIFCVGACLAGIASKETAALAPVMVLLYDRTFVAGGFANAWRARWRLYLGLAATWIPFGLLLLTTGGNRGGTVGFDIGVSWGRFWLTQFEAVTSYLKLSLWPHPLVFDYGRATTQGAGAVLLYAAVVVPLLGLTVVGLWRRPVLGFAGAWLFGLLAPTSLVPSSVQLIVEHRMYLPLAAVAALVVGGLYAWLRGRGLVVAGVAALAGLGLTVMRNTVYASDLSLWSDTVAKRPNNEVALINLGRALADRGEDAEAVACYQRAAAANPRHTQAHYDLANALGRLGRLEEAIGEYRATLQLAPEDAAAHNNLGNTLLLAGRRAEATEHYARAAALKPAFADPHNNLGNLLLQAGRAADALAEFATVLRLAPGSAEAHYNLGNALAQLGRMPEAAAQYEAALRLRPRYVEACVNLGNTFLQRRDPTAALRHYETALQMDPKFPAAHNNLGRALLQLNRLPEAVAQYELALEGDPGRADAHRSAGYVLSQLGRLPEAIAHYEAYLRLVPDDAAIRAELLRLRARR